MSSQVRSPTSNTSSPTTSRKAFSIIGADTDNVASKTQAGTSSTPLPQGSRERAISLQSSLGLKLAALLIDVSGSNDVVILCHGYASGKDGFIMPAIASELARKGLCSLRFDFSGNGQSEGVFEFAGYQREVGDIRAAVAFVRSTLQKNVAAILGHSKGGNIVLLYASTYDDVPLVINVAGRFNMRRGIEERFGAEAIAKVEKLGQVPMTERSSAGPVIKFMLTKQDLAERMNLDMEQASRKITISEVLTIHGTDDTTIPVEDAHAFARCIRNHQLFVVDGADHRFKTAAHAEVCIKKVVEYVKAGI